MLYTSELTDVKKILQSYSSYGLTSTGFDTLLDEAATDAEYWMKSNIGAVYYDAIETKNNVGLTDTEKLMVRADVYAVASEFLWLQNSKKLSSNTVAGGSVADVSLLSKGSTGTSKSFAFYRDKAKTYLTLAGCDVSKKVTHGVPVSEYNTLNPLSNSNDYFGFPHPWPEEYK